MIVSVTDFNWFNEGQFYHAVYLHGRLSANTTQYRGLTLLSYRYRHMKVGVYSVSKTGE